MVSTASELEGVRELECGGLSRWHCPCRGGFWRGGAHWQRRLLLLTRLDGFVLLTGEPLEDDDGSVVVGEGLVERHLRGGGQDEFVFVFATEEV